MMLDALLEQEVDDPDVLECFFLEALYSSLGATLLEDGRVKFDDFIKRLSSMSTVNDELTLAKPGELPGSDTHGPRGVRQSLRSPHRLENVKGKSI